MKCTSRWMQSRATSLMLAGVLATVLGVSGWWTARAADDDQSLSAFMRKKLDASAEILEGLAIEDAELLKSGSEKLLQMSKAEKWNVLADDDYRDFNREFRAAVKELQDAAAVKNFDRALLQWIDATKGCVDCHKYVRKQRATISK
jgi:cytochrome c556